MKSLLGLKEAASEPKLLSFHTALDLPEVNFRKPVAFVTKLKAAVPGA